MTDNSLQKNANAPEFIVKDGVKQQVWRCGTLVYTLSGIILLTSVLLFGDFVIQTRGRSMGMITRLMLKKFEATDFAIGLILSTIPGIVSMIINPIIGVASDRHRGKWGRRIPFIIWTAPFSMLALFLIAASPWIAQQIAFYCRDFMGMSDNQLTVIVIATFYTIFEAVTLVNGSMFNALVNDVAPREWLGRMFALFRIVSLLVGVVYNWCFMGYSETHPALLLTGLGVIYGFGYTLMAFMVKEGEYPPPPPLPQGNATVRNFKIIGGYFKECFSLPFYLVVIGVLVLVQYSFNPINFYGVFFAKSLEVDLVYYGRYIAASYVVSLILTYPLGILVDKFHPLRCSTFGAIAYVLLMVVSPQLVKSHWQFVVPYCNLPITGFGLMVIAHTIVSGLYVTTSATIPLRLFPKEKFAQFSAANAMVLSLFGMITTPIIGKLLDFFGGQSFQNFCHAHGMDFLVLSDKYMWLFVFGAFFGILGIICCVVVWIAAKRYGGLDNYQAPESK